MDPSSTAIAASVAKVALLINGRDYGGSHPFEIESPVTGKTCWEAACTTFADATTAIETAKAAFPAGARTKPAVRRYILLETANVLERRRREFANYMHVEADVLAGLMLNSYRIYMSTGRILVDASIAEEFMDALKYALSMTDAQSHAESMITSAVECGAELLHGKLEIEPSCDGVLSISPFVLAYVNPNMRVWLEGEYTTLTACMLIRSDDEAVRITNSVGYGSSASVFTKDLRKGLAIAKQLEFGVVHMNGMNMHDEPVLPYGGTKDSGWGRFNAEEGLNEYLVTKSVTWKD
ncbi:ALDH-like protein [Aspergillus eucalypticola CBS 122712]|uniref:ALDH-like protein n=1 Tax=Aspergillus eucalypticola (strain CBS 122712 / IBT 29274) TaxID=1448314 RepID=A0A317VKL3_ASPEC|nr:ALDH-like protein [Aspergillus eucalypticola CBS 122712]PWY74873.1 ALDH-like protein [Aspergillus eucalypticola CBS 122712]